MKLFYPTTLGVLCLYLSIMSSESFAQKYKSDSSYVHFFSDAPMEDIEATNLNGQSAFDFETGEIVFSIPISSFEFEKSLMQEHFNENYLESDKYPKATFTGKLRGFSKSIKKKQKATADGTMTIHGVEQQISVEGELLVNDAIAKIECQFPIKLEEYEVKIPKVVFYNIAEVVDVTVNFKYAKIE